MKEIPFKLFDSVCLPDAIGNWTDLKSREEINYRVGERVKVPLGIAMQLPEGYEAWIAPRSSTLKETGLLMGNPPGIIDTDYCGDNDEWFFVAHALKDGVIKKGQRICQFRIVKSQKKFAFVQVPKLFNEDRGGEGSTGKY